MERQWVGAVGVSAMAIAVPAPRVDLADLCRWRAEVRGPVDPAALAGEVPRFRTWASSITAGWGRPRGPWAEPRRGHEDCADVAPAGRRRGTPGPGVEASPLAKAAPGPAAPRGSFLSAR
jgi:hypothetical protein